MSTAQHTPVAAEHAREALEAYGRMMYDAGMDAASDFRDRHREGEAKEQDAAEMLDAYVASQSTPPPESAGQPLTEEQIENEYANYLAQDERRMTGPSAFRSIVRHIESVRGLAANPTAQPDGGSKA